MILTGDFNSPKQELMSGEVITWGQKMPNSSGKVRIAVNPKWKDSVLVKDGILRKLLKIIQI